MIKIYFKGREKLYDSGQLREVCFECSVCKLHCVVENLEGYGGRNAFLYDLFGSGNPVIHRALWSCSGCHKCVEVCPQDVDPLRVIINLQERSFEEGKAPSYVYDLDELVLETGMSFPVTKKTIKDREKLGLSPLSPIPVDEIKQITVKTGLREKLTRKDR
jgi:heterodisulfide reductase subunit C